MTDYIASFESIVQEQLQRLEKIKTSPAYTDYASLDSIVIGMIEGDGIGPVIMTQAARVLQKLLQAPVASGKIQLRQINGLTLENRISNGETLPAEVLAQIKKCHVLLKGPTTTPDKSAGLTNLESANVALRRELDLFANVRPVCIPEKNISWVFYRENTEGEYVLGSKGADINDEMSIDFKVITDAGTRRIAKAAFQYAKANGNLNVSIVTKANIMKKTDGKFKTVCYEVARGYPEIKTDDWYVDIMAANLVNPQLQSSFNVFVLPNLYGDIITDEAAQIQGGVGTAGSANIGGQYAMFEAIHGSAPRMVADGLAHLANPSSILKATEMLLRHIGYVQEAGRLGRAVEKAQQATDMSGMPGGDTAVYFTDIVLKALQED